MTTPIVWNGIDATTGDYLLSPMAAEDAAALAAGGEVDAAAARHFETITAHAVGGNLGVEYQRDPQDLADVGWGVALARGADPAILEALAPLLSLRKAQSEARGSPHYHLFAGDKGYLPGQTKAQFLRANKASAGPVNPLKMPYYVLLVGGPDEIPFSFQHQLDVQHAVGRIHFATLAEYAAYAESVVASETAPRPVQRAVFFGPRADGDVATELSADELVVPLGASARAAFPGLQIDTISGDQALKQSLSSLLSGPDRPSLLFAASHGVAFPSGDARQPRHQGALLCQDWPGPKAWGRRQISNDLYFSADDVPALADSSGLIAVFFACFGAGTPARDEISFLPSIAPRVLAPAPFVAGLPQRLLGRKNGALAVLGHVDRALSWSFQDDDGNPQIETLRSIVRALLEGSRLGAATELAGARFAEIAAELAEEQRAGRNGKVSDPMELATLWARETDARNYAVIGDPAVRLALPGSLPRAAPGSPVRCAPRSLAGALSGA